MVEKAETKKAETNQIVSERWKWSRGTQKSNGTGRAKKWWSSKRNGKVVGIAATQKCEAAIGKTRCYRALVCFLLPKINVD